ncbi:MAG: adenosylmethionine--8-amino-7-oxononanoate aminotransferase BioA, partial [Methylococcales bacterium]|nr:adenosylmethionine--8-amino-7-oxononanoate aminotransferase BioA [Methylococcales bacterium]
NAALKIQLDTLEHVIFSGFIHETTIDYVKKSVNLMPAGLSRCFYADNDASAVEAALKMSFYS